MFKPALLSSNEKTIYCLAQEFIKKQQLSKEYRVAQEMVTELLIYLLKSTAQQLAGEAVAEDSGSEASDED